VIKVPSWLASAHMKIRMIAMSNREVYVASDTDGNYYVLSLDDTRELGLGDFLSGVFDGHGSLFMTVKNLTQGHDIRICLEDWECSLNGALGHLLRLSTPSRFFVGSKTIEADSHDAAGQLRHEIVRV
jgi:hypothetical protein